MGRKRNHCSMTKKLLNCAIALIILLVSAMFGIYLFNDDRHGIILVQSMENVRRLPKNFRTTDSPLKEGDQTALPSVVGLKELHASGSGQYSQRSLEKMVETLGDSIDLYLVDLRQESHGFINGIPVGWYAPKGWSNQGKSIGDIAQEEIDLLNGLLEQQYITAYKILAKSGTGLISSRSPIKIHAQEALTEDALVNRMGLHYQRLPVTDHLKPDPECVDNFIKFINALPKNAWVHFHCSAGGGRSTCFLAMYDMLRNAKDVSFTDILERQWLIGGRHFQHLPDKSSWKYSSSVDRLKFLELFYEYCRSSDGNDSEAWSSYLKKRGG